jgi:hypothetical protein
LLSPCKAHLYSVVFLTKQLQLSDDEFMPQSKKQNTVTPLTLTKAKITLTIAITCYILLLLYLVVSVIYYKMSGIDDFYLFLLELLPCLLVSYFISSILLTVGLSHKKFLFITVLVIHFVIGFILFYTLANDFLTFLGISLFYMQFPLPVLIFIICIIVLNKEGLNKNK